MEVDAGAIGGRAKIVSGGLPERTNGTASKVVVASGSPWVRIPRPPPPGFPMFPEKSGKVGNPTFSSLWYYSSMPRRTAQRMSSLRRRSRSLSRMFRTWFSTVFSEMNNVSPISR